MPVIRVLNRFQTKIEIFNGWLFRANNDPFFFSIQRGAIALVGSAIVATLFSIGDIEIRKANSEYLFAQILTLTLFAPLFENLVLVFFLELVNKCRLSITMVTLFSALLMSSFHAIFSFVWGVVILWPFYIFGAIYLTLRDLGKKKAYFLSVLAHSIQNLPPAIMLYVAERTS